MINLHWLYVLAGAAFAGFAVSSARDRTNQKRWGNAAFWGLLVASFWFGDFLGDIGNGVLVLALVALLGGAVNGTEGSLELMAYILFGGLAGIVAILALAWLVSTNRRAIRPRVVGAAFARRAGIQTDVRVQAEGAEERLTLHPHPLCSGPTHRRQLLS